MKETRCLSRESWSDYQRVFESSSGCDGCWCFKHRSGFSDETEGDFDARVAMRDLIRKEEVNGVIAYQDHVPVGWMGFEPASKLKGIWAGVESEDAWVIHCIFVDPAYRDGSIARLLLSGALFQLRSRKVKKVMSFASTGQSKEHSDSASHTISFFERAGFRKACDINESISKMVLTLSY